MNFHLRCKVKKIIRNFATNMHQKTFQLCLTILWVAISLTGCGHQGKPKPLTTPLDSITVDTTAVLEHGDLCKVHLKMFFFKGSNAATLNDSLLRMGILQPDYMATSYEQLSPRTALPAYVRRLIEEQADVFHGIRRCEPNTAQLRFELSVDTEVLAGADDAIIYVAHTRTTTNDNSLAWTVVRNMTPNGKWIRLSDAFSEEELKELPSQIISQMAENLDLDDTTSVRKQGYFSGIDAYATDNFMLFDDSVKFIYAPGEISLAPISVTLNR